MQNPVAILNVVSSNRGCSIRAGKANEVNVARIARVSIKSDRAFSALERATRERVSHCFSDCGITS